MKLTKESGNKSVGIFIMNTVFVFSLENSFMSNFLRDEGLNEENQTVS